MTNILHIITGLETGGAERSLANLALMERSGQFRHHIVSLAGLGRYGPELMDAAIPVTALNIGTGQGLRTAYVRLRRLVNEISPSIVHGWMYHGSLAASAVTLRVHRRPALAWNIRHTLTELDREKRGTRMVIRALPWIPGRPRAIIYNSHRARAAHELFGFPVGVGHVVPNGFDTNRWRPDSNARAALRQQFAIADDAIVIGYVGRYHPIKNVPSLLSAVRIVLEQEPRAHLMVAGEGILPSNRELASLIAALPKGRAHLLGQRKDIEAVMPAFDIFALSSDSEAFPNVLGEAMACGLPCVATDVGDCRLLLDGCGSIVPPGETQALADELLAMVRSPDAARWTLGAAARSRIQQQYSMAATIDSYRALYTSLT